LKFVLVVSHTRGAVAACVRCEGREDGGERGRGLVQKTRDLQDTQDMDMDMYMYMCGPTYVHTSYTHVRTPARVRVRTTDKRVGGVVPHIDHAAKILLPGLGQGSNHLLQVRPLRVVALSVTSR